MLPLYIIGPGGKWWRCTEGLPTARREHARGCWGDPTPPRNGVASCQIAADGYDGERSPRDYASPEDLETVMQEHRRLAAPG